MTDREPRSCDIGALWVARGGDPLVLSFSVRVLAENFARQQGSIKVEAVLAELLRGMKI